MAYTAYVQRLIGRLYPLWYFYLPTCRFTAQKDFVDGRVVHGRGPSGVCWHREALPLPPCVAHPHDEVQDAMRAQFALWTTLGHGEGREEQCGKLAVGQWHGDRRRCRLFSQDTPLGRASLEEF
jgi:hypothetical protein